MSLSGALTAPSDEPVALVAESFMRAAATRAFEMTPQDFAGVYLSRQYKTEHNGVTHFVYRQRFDGIPVYNAAWSVNVDREGRVINAGGILFPRPASGFLPPSPATAARAAKAAAEAVNLDAAARFNPVQESDSAKSVRFARGEFGAEIEGEPVWYGVNGVLHGSWLFRITDTNGIEQWETVVESRTARLLEKEPLTFYQSAPKGLVFERNSPQPNPQPGSLLGEMAPYVERTSQSFAGDPQASPRGWVAGSSTSGNNAIAGTNHRGVTLLLTPGLAISAARDFAFPLELGVGKPHPGNYSDAATTNLFYWTNRAHDLFYEAGFNEAAGNFQTDNFGRGGSGGDPMYAYSHFGSSANAFAQLGNAFFSLRRREDGAQSGIHMFLSFGPNNDFTDGSYDNEVIIHEYTHGVSLRAVPLLSGFQGGALGEAWSDFFALEFTLPEGAPAEGVYPTGEYFVQAPGQGIRTRPYSTRADINPLTFQEFGRVLFFPEIHADGEIWVQALMDVRAALIAQFGEKEGRRRVRRLVMDGMKLCPPAPSFVDARDAILAADRVNYDGASQTRLWQAFAKRGLGVLAHSNGSNTIHVLASNETPNNAGALRVYESSYTHGQTVQVVLHDGNLKTDQVAVDLTSSSGDVEQVILQKTGATWSALVPTSTAGVTKQNRILNLAVGDFISVYYSDVDTGSGARQVSVTVPTTPPYAFSLNRPAFRSGGDTSLGLRGSFTSRRRVDLPFDFPFYGKKYRSVFAYAGGLLAFELGPGTACTDSNALSRFAGIAPLWMELRTDGNVQRDEGVFVSRTESSVTFRWAAETDTLGIRQPEPVNFSATLYDDGRIDFNYGSGNKNLGVGLPFPGCPVSTPTVGISDGSGTLVQTAFTHHGFGGLENAEALIWFPPFGFSSLPQGRIESPAPDGAVNDVLSIRGAVFDERELLVRAQLFIDNEYRGAASFPAQPRPVECTTGRFASCVALAFDQDVSLLGLAPGRHTMRFRVSNARGGFTDFPSEPMPFNVEPGQRMPPVVRIEAPLEGAVFRDEVVATGYAYLPGDLRVVAVDAIIDGITYSRTAYGLPRNEVCGSLNPRPVNCPAIGFTLRVNIRDWFVPLPAGEHGFQVRVQDSSGRVTLYPETPVKFRVDLRDNQPPKAVLVTPAQNSRLSGIVNLYGYAWDPDGRVVAAVLIVDGEARARFNYGEARTSECAAERLPGCPNIGLNLDFDTRVLLNGQHTFQLAVADNENGVAFLNPLNIVVDNR